MPDPIPTSPISPLPGQVDQSASLAAPAKVGQAGGTFDTLKFRFCPWCGERLSYTSYEGYCACADCLWNNNECSP